MTASKAHEVVTKMTKVEKDGGGKHVILEPENFRTGFC